MAWVGLGLLACVGCGGGEVAEEPGGAEATGAESPPSEAEPAEEPTGDETTPETCAADADHCCTADGRLVVPGGCQPIYRGDVEPATQRGADGRCESIPCTLRCLPASARIETPSGPRAITELSIGDLVLTRDADGTRVEQPLLRVSATAVTGPHTIVEIALVDGRVLRGSAGHPLAGGGAFGDLETGAPLDGSTVRAVRNVPYEGAATWDVLPAGETGQYWADGVLVGSTLAP